MIRKCLRLAGQFGFVLLFAVALSVTDYIHQDIALAYPGEVWLATVLHTLAAALIFAVVCAVLRSGWGRVGASIILVYLLMQRYPDLDRLLSPFTRHLPLAGTLVAVFTMAVVLGLTFGLERYLTGRHDTVSGVLYGLLRGVCVAVFVFNGWMFVKVWTANAAAMNYRPADNYRGLKLAKQPDRDIYYLVFDDYDSNLSLKKYLGFDNSSWADGLRQRGFVVRDDAYANFQTTAPSVASTLQMDYLQDVGKQLHADPALSYIPYQTIIRDAPVDRLLDDAGYDTVLLGSWWNVTRYQNNARPVLPEFTATILNHTFIMSEIQSNALARMFLWRWFAHGVKVGGLTIVKASQADPRTMALDQVATLKKMAAQPHDKPRFVFAHILNPHSPFVFNAKGDQPGYDTETNNNGLPEKQKYVNQIKYINNVITDTVSKIQAGSKKPPIIILQSDEGEGFVGDAKYGPGGSVDANRSKYGTMAAYYLPGATAGTVAQLGGSVNAFRFVLNEYFGTNLPYLPDCSFFADDATPFVFKDITSKLHPASPKCKNYLK